MRTKAWWARLPTAQRARAPGGWHGQRPQAVTLCRRRRRSIARAPAARSATVAGSGTRTKLPAGWAAPPPRWATWWPRRWRRSHWSFVPGPWSWVLGERHRAGCPWSRRAASPPRAGESPDLPHPATITVRHIQPPVYPDLDNSRFSVVIHGRSSRILASEGVHHSMWP